MKTKQLTVNDIQLLRTRGLLTESETAFKEGDLLIAENVTTKQRRVLNAIGLILEADRQLLND